MATNVKRLDPTFGTRRPKKETIFRSRFSSLRVRKHKGNQKWRRFWGQKTVTFLRPRGSKSVPTNCLSDIIWCRFLLCLWAGGTSPSARSTQPALHGRQRFPFPPNDLGPTASLTCSLPHTKGTHNIKTPFQLPGMSAEPFGHGP
jgi:hypothetical protein